MATASSVEILLSILIASVPERLLPLSRMLSRLSEQTFEKPVEILVLTDNRCMTIGKKRQRLNEMAQGKYVIHVDDDDTVSDDFVDSLLPHIYGEQYDCITFTCMCEGDDGKGKVPCFYSKSFPHIDYPTFRLRRPNCRCCYRRTVALRHAFSDVAYGEDDEWAKRACQDIVHEIQLPKVLYYYTYITKPMDWFTAQGTIKYITNAESENGEKEDGSAVPQQEVMLSKDTECAT